MTGRERRLTTIVAIDVAGYSRLMHADEAGTLDRLRAARAITDPIAEVHDARIVGTWGDGLLVEFPSVVQAVEFARKAQAAMAAFNADTPEDRQLLYRIGINLGDVIVEDGDLFGDGVNVAARLEALSPPGGIGASRAARDQVLDKLDVAFEDLGEVEVKNIARPVRAFRVLREGEVMVAPPTPRRRWPALTAAAGLLAAVLAGAGYWYTQRPEFTPADPANMEYAIDDKPSIAVLAFDNLTGDPEQEHVSDGISEDIITTLARLPGVLVIARNSSFAYKGQPVDIRRIAEEMSVRYVLEGSVQSFGDNVRITAQLIDAVSGHHVWSEKYDRPLSEFFKVRDEITFEIVSELNMELVEGENFTNEANSFRTLEGWLLARKATAHYLRWNKTDNQISLDLAYQILEIEPESIRAHMAVVFRIGNALAFHWADDREAAIPTATEYAEKTIALDPSSPAGHSAMAYVLFVQGRISEAIQFGEQTIERAPGDAGALALLAFYYQKDMQADRAVETFERAVRIDRRAPTWVWENYGEALIIAGRYADAVPIYFETLKSAQGHPAGECHLGLAIAYDALGQEERARAAVRAAVETVPIFTVAYLREFQTYKDQDYKERWLTTLKRLGLPEE